MNCALKLQETYSLEGRASQPVASPWRVCGAREPLPQSSALAAGCVLGAVCRPQCSRDAGVRSLPQPAARGGDSQAPWRGAGLSRCPWGVRVVLARATEA